MNKKIVLILGLIVLLFSCKTDYGNDLRYCYLNSDNTQYASAEREYKDLLNLPIKTRIESTFRIDSIRLDTLNEITSESLRLKLFNNFIINGFYWFDSSIKLDQLVHPSTPRLKYEEYINQ